MKIRIYEAITLFLFLLVLLYAGCNKYEINKKLMIQNEEPTNIASFSQLTFNNFNSIILSQESFSYIFILYSNYEDTKIKQLGIDAGNLGASVYFANITHFTGGLSLIDNVVFSYNHEFSTCSFTKSEIEHILNYLSSNSEYFFNGSEYDELNTPIESSSMSICLQNYNFSFIIFQQNSMINAWGIHKCVDEYPGPDHPLYGLFQILENDFISKFEEEE